MNHVAVVGATLDQVEARRELHSLALRGFRIVVGNGCVLAAQHVVDGLPVRAVIGAGRRQLARRRALRRGRGVPGHGRFRCVGGRAVGLGVRGDEAHEQKQTEAEACHERV